MTTPANVITPDAEAWVWANISHVPGVTSFSYSATREHPDWLTAVFVQVDARATGKAAARDRAELVRQIIAGLPEVPWAEGVVAYSQPVEGPFWQPDPEGEPRYTARYELRVHPLRTAP